LSYVAAADIPVLTRPGHHWPLALCTGGYERGPPGITIAGRQPLIGDYLAGKTMDASHAAGG